MSDSLPKPWSDNPYAPKISRHVYLVEKNSFGGVLTSLIPYGTRKRARTRLPIRAHFVRLVYPRDAHCTVIQVHGHTV